MVLIGILNGALREWTYGKHLDELRAHQISTLTGILLFSLYIWGVTRFWSFASAQQALIVGLIWLGLTIVFEFGFGHYVAGHPWSQLVADYNLLAGRVWLVVLIWITVAPLLFYRLLPR
jgi:hypothetical protein